jgi:Domain of unknown function (DUF6916)
MTFSRRDIMQSVLAAGAAIVLPVRAFASPAADQEISRIPEHIPMHPDLAMTREAFERQLDRIFLIVRADEPAFRIQLTKVVDAAGAVAAGTVGSQLTFTARFIGPADPWLPEGTYLVETPEYGRMALYLQHGQPVAGETVYEASFNRLTEQTPDRAMRARPPGR